MRRRVLTVIAVIGAIAVIIFASVGFYPNSNGSPPFKANWETNIGYQNAGISGGIAYSSENYFLLSLKAIEMIIESQSISMNITALNSTTGSEVWSLPFGINTTEQTAWVIGPTSTNETYGDLPQIHYFNHVLYLTAYCQNYSLGSQTRTSENGTNALIVKLSPSNGSVLSIGTVYLGTLQSNWTSLTMQWWGGFVYLGYQTDSAGLLKTHLYAVNATSSHILWNQTVQVYSKGAYGPSGLIYPSQEYLAVVADPIVNDSAVLYSISRSSGDIVSNYSISGLLGLNAVLGNDFVYTSLIGGFVNINVVNLSTDSVDNFSTVVQVNDNFISNVQTSMCRDVLLVSYNSTVYAYSMNERTLLWKEHLKFVGTDGYSYGFLNLGKDELLYWAEVEVFYEANYRVTYNYFAELNASNGHVFWQKSFQPFSTIWNSKVVNRYSIICLDGNQLLYERLSSSGLIVSDTSL